MWVCQEYFYFTKGTYRHRKWMKHFYLLGANGSFRLVKIVREGDLNPPIVSCASLPSVEVTPRQFKELASLRVQG